MRKGNLSEPLTNYLCTESEEWSSQWIFQFKQLERISLKKNQGFNGIRTHDLRDTGAVLYQLNYEATHWERGQFIEFISPVRSEMTRSIYEIIHICTVVVDESEEIIEWSLFTFIYYRSANMNYFIYTSRHYLCTRWKLVYMCTKSRQSTK